MTNDSLAINEFYTKQKEALIRVSAGYLLALQKQEPVRLIKDRLKKLLGKDVRSRDELFWPLGMLLLGLLEAGEEESVRTFFDKWISRGKPVLFPDDALAAYVLVRLYETTGQEKYLEGADAAAEFLRTTERDPEGAIVYQPGKPVQNILADGAGMTALFLHRYGICRSDAEAVRDAEKQLRCFFRHGMDEKTGLPYHGYDLKSGERKGLIGWGRAAGWLLMGLAECGMTEVQETQDPADPDADGAGLLKTVLDYRREDGLFPWHLPAEDPADTSATGMIAWSLLQVQEPEKYRPEIIELLEGLTGQIHDGIVEGALAECVDLGVHPQKYGHYPWGQGAVLAALAGASREKVF